MPDPTQTSQSFTDALNTALDEVDRITGLRDEAAKQLKNIPDDKDHNADRRLAQQRVENAETELARAYRAVSNIQARQGTVETRVTRSEKPKDVPKQMTDHGLMVKDDVANPSPDGSPGWRLATDANGNPIGAKDTTNATARTQIAGQNADTNATRAATGQQNADTNAVRAATGQQNADTNRQNADTRAAVGNSTIDRNEASAARTAALTPYQVQELQARGVLTVAQAQAITDKTPAQIEQMIARGELSSAQAAQVRQKMQLAVAPQDVSAPTTQPYIAQRNPLTGEITWVPDKNFQPQDIGLRVKQLQDQASAERDRIAELPIDDDQKRAQFDTWWQQNIQPVADSLQHAQAQADYANQRQYASDRASQAQNEADYERQRQETALTAGRNAVDDTMKTLPYRVGAGFGGDFANALKTLSGGGGAVSFGANDFTYDMPDFNQIAEQATARALADISPYAAYKAGVSIPTPPRPYDIAGQLNQSKYTPAQQTDPAAVVHAAVSAALQPANPSDSQPDQQAPPDFQPTAAARGFQY